MEHFELKGGGGTDFRPVFSHVEELGEQGELRGSKGLLYFTDGKGRYPKKRPDYDVAFLFMQERVFYADVSCSALGHEADPVRTGSGRSRETAGQKY